MYSFCYFLFLIVILLYFVPDTALALTLTSCDDNNPCTIDSCHIGPNNTVQFFHVWDHENCGECQPMNQCSGQNIDQCTGQCNDCDPCTLDFCGPCTLHCENPSHVPGEIYFCQCLFAPIRPSPLGCGGNFPDCKWQLTGLLSIQFFMIFTHRVRSHGYHLSISRFKNKTLHRRCTSFFFHCQHSRIQKKEEKQYLFFFLILQLR